MAVYRRFIPTTDPRLGRHVEHDDRSWLYPYPIAGLSVGSVVHRRHIGILDQGNVGSCTGQAGIGALATDPLFGALPVTGGYLLDEDGAIALYSAAETIDGDGPYPPNDYGSSGLSIAKALTTAGQISGYQHTFSLDAALKALGETPVITGLNWYGGMFAPDSDGRLHITGQVAGGHELEIREVDADREIVWLDNSWGPGWGKAGRAYLTFTDWGRLLGEEGDVTVLLPATAAPPTPDPAELDRQLAAAVRAEGWVTGRHLGRNARVARAVQRWLAAKDL